MSGRHIFTSQEKHGRREFLKSIAAMAAIPLAAPLMNGCSQGDKYAHITGGIVGANHKVGHLLRSGNFPSPTKELKTDVLIVGGGISGLSAKRWLEKNGVSEIMLLEMDDKVGGNSISGVNAASAYPWAAHYLPIPDTENTELIDFLRSIDVITSFNKDGLPMYNEYYLCHDPEERLYINGSWQEGLIPQFGIGNEDKRQIAAFLQHTERLKTAKGNDGKFCFRIPLDTSTEDGTYRQLDNISFDRYLKEHGYTSPYLRWYLEYCVKDDYGSNLEQTSAWAGLHYFASRKGKAANAASSAVLTWPEGNAFLMNALKRQALRNTKTGMLVYGLNITNEGAEVLCYDVHAETSIAIRTNKVLLATPQYINKRILGISGHQGSTESYAPWVVANITLNHLPGGKGFPLCWDNVIYGQESVGYVYANHQDLSRTTKGGVITYYLPIVADNDVTARSTVHNSTYATWRERVIRDLSFAHPGIENSITNIDVWIWGHGMIRPSAGYIWSKSRQQAMQPLHNKVFFAHSDLSGISIFEEAFYQGIKAAKQILQTV